MSEENVFQSIALSQVPRILGFIDADEQSKTVGCCDRHYWHYKTSDVTNARFQEAALTLASVYSLNYPDNPYFKSPKLKPLILSIVDYWNACVHRDGSVDESYPQEHHFCATALSLFSITESLLLIGAIPVDDFSRTIKYLSKHDHPAVGNQTAGAALTLYNIYLLTQRDLARKASEEKLDCLLKRQTNEGYFSEYDGFDLGYNSITLSFLAALYKKTGRDDIKKAALRVVDFMVPQINEHGYYSPKGMSRNTQFLYPFGFAVFAPEILKRLENGLRQGRVLNPLWLDDRYCIPLTNDYLLTALHMKLGV